MSRRAFLLSPANMRGVRGRRILDGSSRAPFMEALRGGDRVSIGDVYESISSLYYRGKRAYARRFGQPSGDALVITSTRGLMPDSALVGLDDLHELAGMELGPDNLAYVSALKRSAVVLREDLGVAGQAVLLGSLASAKYLEPLVEVLGDRLHVPLAFVGRGDMSRGGLMLRCVADGVELTYGRASILKRRGPRPPRLGTRSGTSP